MKITKLEKKKQLYLMEIDGTDNSYITEDTLVKFVLTKGKVLTAEELSDIKAFAHFSYAKNLALYHLSFKQRTIREVRDYLLRNEIDETIASRVIENLIADNWLDDRRYTRQTLESNLHTGDKGPYLLRQKLAQKGISKTIIDEGLAQFEFSKIAERLTVKLLRKYEGKYPTKGLKDKITQNLLNKGFSYEDAKEALSQQAWEQDEETTQELIFKELDKQYRKYSKKYDGYDLNQRLTQALARKGYDFSDIKSALRDYL